MKRHQGLAHVSKADELEALIPLERARLVRLCARLTGDREAAEDLAQETLFEAWRNVHGLRDPQACPRWLSGIARNICLRWARTRGRELSRLVPLDADENPDAPRVVEGQADSFDMEVELERAELVGLLDKALALLPPETRDVLLERYVEESPHAEIAARLGVSEKAVSMRLSRGKLACRHVLTTDLRSEAAAYGIVAAENDAWQETRIWCPFCGWHRLLARFTDGHT